MALQRHAISAGALGTTPSSMHRSARATRGHGAELKFPEISSVSPLATARPQRPCTMDPFDSVLRFADFEWRPHEQRLTQAGVAVDIGGRAFSLLGLLAARSGDVVSKDEAFAHVWPGRVIEDNNLQVQVASLRRLMGREAIATVPGRGYRFTLAVQRQGAETTPSAPKAAEAPAPWKVSPRFPGAPAGKLLGRETELLAVAPILQPMGVVTLVGEGGIGKTRLAWQLARDWAHQHPDQGLAWADLMALRDSDGLAGLLATALGLQQPMGQTPGLMLAGSLRTHRGLLVLDNCEHLSGEVAALLVPVLAAASGLTVLATSQRRLNLSAEQVFRVQPLGLPQRDDLAGVQASPAVQLLVQRIHALDRNFMLTEANAAQAADLCRQLDGLALAIELAAGQVARLGLPAVCSRLGARLRLLAGGPVDSPPRHRTLLATMDWSHALLDEGERVVFRRLAVFAGGFSLQAMLAVLPDPNVDGWTCAEALSNLVDRCLVVAGPLDEQGEPRYRLLDSTRSFATSLWIDAGERAAVGERHARWMHQLFEDAFAHQATQTDIAWRTRFGPELDNLRAALNFCFGDGGPRELGIGLAGWSADLWPMLSLLEEGRRQLDRAQAQLRPDTPSRAAAALWDGLGYLWQDADPQRALAAREHAETLWRQVSDRRWVRSVLGQAWNLLYLDQLAECESALQQTEAWLGRSMHLQALHQTTLGALRQRQHRPEDARAAYLQALAMRQAMGDQRRALIMMLNLADLAFSCGDAAEAATLGAQAAAEAERQGDLALLGVVLGNLAAAQLWLGQVAPALGSLHRAVPLLREGDGLVWFMDVGAWLLACQGRTGDAAMVLGHADAALARRGVTRQTSELRVLDRLLAELHKHHAAAEVQAWRQAGQAWRESDAVHCLLAPATQVAPA